ncbi:SHOCT domain-containing protein [Mycobacterium sp. Y57]|uniref:SHOCT domain-containing protein n=1 Tax=Mycolicibacterium xanthum TaxID=2796469 RepID=UPI001C84A304|nr:SHOCT domain-containing protein [Mycolicibacterium xanthum]MBX7431563.1 SHOCT domain-containing protein [Mycolicibacterium xanthum]
MTGRVGRRVALTGAILLLVVGVAGFVVTLVLNIFVFDDYDAYGEVPIPGSGRLQLPAGEVTVNFHTAVPGGVNGGFPVPPLQLGITPPDGVPDPVVTESFGSTTSVNSDVRIRVWVAQIPADGVYDVAVRGDVAGYIHPQLAFGRDSSRWWLVWVFVAVFVVGIGAVILTAVASLRTGRAPQPLPGPVRLDAHERPGDLPHEVSYQPTDQGVRLEQLKTLAALRDSGALTQAEFDAEKRRILEG